MSETKRRIKKDPPPAETTATPPRQTRVTLTKDVSSRYRKLVPRAQAGESAKSRPPRAQRPPAGPERGAPPKRPRRRDNPGPGGPSEALKTLIDLELPEATRQLHEAQRLLHTTAEEMLTLLEDWDNRPPEETKGSQALVTALFEKMSFQDLAGQRLAKVETFLKALGGDIQPGALADRRPPRQAEPPPKTGPAGAPETRPEKTLKGPQMPESRLGQNEVDQILMALLLR